MGGYRRMNPFIKKHKMGWWCVPCRLQIYGLQDAQTHGIYEHHVPADFLAMDAEGDFFDLRGLDLPKLCREGGLV